MLSESKYRSRSLNESMIPQQDYAILRQNNYELAEKVAQLQRTCSSLNSDLDNVLKQKFQLQQKLNGFRRCIQGLDGRIRNCFHMLVEGTTELAFVLNQFKILLCRGNDTELTENSLHGHVEETPLQNLSQQIVDNSDDIEKTLGQMQKRLGNKEDNSQFNAVDQDNFTSRGGSSTNLDLGAGDSEMEIEEPIESQCISSRRLSVILEDSVEKHPTIITPIGGPHSEKSMEFTNRRNSPPCEKRTGGQTSSLLRRESKDYENIGTSQNISSIRKETFQEDSTSLNELKSTINKTQTTSFGSPYPESNMELTKKKNSSTPKGRFSGLRTSLLRTSDDFEGSERSENISVAKKKLFQEGQNSSNAVMNSRKNEALIMDTEGTPEDLSTMKVSMISSTPINHPKRTKLKRSKRDGEFDDFTKSRDENDESLHIVKRCKRKCTSYKYNPIAEFFNLQTRWGDERVGYSNTQIEKGANIIHKKIKRVSKSRTDTNDKSATSKESTPHHSTIQNESQESTSYCHGDNSKRESDDPIKTKGRDDDLVKQRKRKCTPHKYDSLSKYVTTQRRYKELSHRKSSPEFYADTMGETSEERSPCQYAIPNKKRELSRENIQDCHEDNSKRGMKKKALNSKEQLRIKNAVTSAAPMPCVSHSNGRSSSSKCNGRSKRRVAQKVTYTEPNLNKKMRRED